MSSFAPQGTAAHRPVDEPTPRSPGRGLRALVGLSGALTGGLVALAGALMVAQWLVSEANRPGPGIATVIGHAVAALVAVVLQGVADRSRARSRGGRAALAAVAVLLLVSAVLWFGWYA